MNRLNIECGILCEFITGRLNYINNAAEILTGKFKRLYNIDNVRGCGNGI